MNHVPQKLCRRMLRKIQLALRSRTHALEHTRSNTRARTHALETQVQLDRKEREIKEEASKRARDEVDGEQMLKLKQELKEAKEHQKLMKEHLDVTKDLLNAKNSQVVEIEYQWAAAKAKLAQAQLDREELDADVCVLEDLVTKLKLKAVKTAQDLKSLRLTKKQTTRFYSL